MEAPSSSETSVLTRVTRRNIPEDGILHSHRCENLKSYIVSCLLSLHNFSVGINNLLLLFFPSQFKFYSVFFYIRCVSVLIVPVIFLCTNSHSLKASVYIIILGFISPHDGILHIHRRETLRYYEYETCSLSLVRR
jgi:hypothetical protein